MEDYPEDDIKTGVKFLRSPITDTLYRVTKWVDKGEGRFVAIEKEEVDEQ